MAVTPDRRPAHHLTAAHGWLNDPHGVTFHGGLYHAFYQANPAGLEWARTVSWGHATSPDLMTWTIHPEVLHPGEGDLGCWTGAVVAPPQGPAAMFYTSVNEPDLDLGEIRRASPVDDTWLRWAKDGTVLAAPADVAVFRDPAIRWDGERWRMVVGAGYPDGRPAVLGWSSTDLHRWDVDGEVAVGTPDPLGPFLGSAWECPQVVHVDGFDVLLVGTWEAGRTHEVVAGVGHLRDGRLEPSRFDEVTAGHSHYAVTVFDDADGAPCALFWIRGVGDVAEGWSGALSIPYLLGCPDGRLLLRPHPAARRAAVAEGRGLQGFDWLPADSGVVEVDADGTQVATLAHQGSVVEVRAGGRTVTLPAPPARHPVVVLVDGCVLEVCTGHGVAGVQVAVAAGPLRTRGDGLTAWADAVPPAPA